MFFNNILACTYKFYGRFKNEAPYSSSIFYTILCQTVILFLIVSIVKVSFSLDFSYLYSKPFWVLPIIIVWTIIAFKYYSKERVAQIVERFNQKSLNERRWWGFIALASFILPMLSIMILLTKR